MIEFVRVNPKYVDALRKIDSRVQSNSAMQGKDTKPFLGVLFTIKENGIKYYAPLSSPKQKHLTMPNGADFHKILDRNGQLLSVINFNNMIPVSDDCCTKIDFSTDKDRFLLQKEYLFCRDNEEVLKEKAKRIYSRYSKGVLTATESKRTCDFRLLENEMNRYLRTEKAASEQQSGTVHLENIDTKNEKIEIEPLRIFKQTDSSVLIKLPGATAEEKKLVWLPKEGILLNKDCDKVIGVREDLQQKHSLGLPQGKPKRYLK